MALDFYKKRVLDLENDLSNTKIFLGMVISELRDPISTISHVIDWGIIKLERALQLLRNYENGLENDIIFIRDIANSSNRMEVDASSSAQPRHLREYSSL